MVKDHSWRTAFAFPGLEQGFGSSPIWTPRGPVDLAIVEENSPDPDQPALLRVNSPHIDQSIVPRPISLPPSFLEEQRQLHLLRFPSYFPRQLPGTNL